MTVKELRDTLKRFLQDLVVAYSCCSEHAVLEADELEIKNLCEPRPDGWIQNAQPDKPARKYLVIPGN